ncbi:MAG: hypothetical protein K0S37_4017, partial [Microbacterium sp.]|nr:hypothetical protein [Microbacterium sp.]
MALKRLTNPTSPWRPAAALLTALATAASLFIATPTSGSAQADETPFPS